VLHIPRPGKISQPEETKDIDLDNNKYFSFCNQFKYLGSIFTNNLNDSEDINRRIKQATAAFASLSDNILRNKKISKKLRKRTYEAIIINLLLWGCESWAIKEKDRQRLEVCHHRCMRRMLNITIYDVQENHITNEKIRDKMNNSLTISQMMEIRRARWLEKISHADSNRNTRKLLISWLPTPRPAGRPQQTIRHGYAKTIEEKLNFPNSNLKTWMPMAQKANLWAEHVEEALKLPKNTYKKRKNKKRNLTGDAG
jgi:hypothetical protein